VDIETVVLSFELLRNQPNARDRLEFLQGLRVPPSELRVLEQLKEVARPVVTDVAACDARAEVNLERGVVVWVPREHTVHAQTLSPLLLRVRVWQVAAKDMPQLRDVYASEQLNRVPIGERRRRGTFATRHETS
jgi:hypothetical protein